MRDLVDRWRRRAGEAPERIEPRRPRAEAWWARRLPGEAGAALGVIALIALVGFLFGADDRRGAVSGYPFGFFVLTQLAPMAAVILAFWLAGADEDDGK